ncbi:hypothetical protein E4T56_gene12405 [Termitomyces sp. T112]|nr:hypothetical protein E4T56_gene12405 [Termitomyces sp. T112]
MHLEKLDPALAHSNQTQNDTKAKASESVDYNTNSNAERKLVRKLDVSLLPLFALAYCTNFIDRTSIGNAKIAGEASGLYFLSHF